MGAWTIDVMKQKIRRQELIKESKFTSLSGKDMFSEEAMRRCDEKEKNSSENRFDVIALPEEVQTFSKATLEFQSKHGLKVIVTKSAKEMFLHLFYYGSLLWVDLRC